MPTSTKYKLYN